jgi:hypothetical protein
MLLGADVTATHKIEVAVGDGRRSGKAFPALVMIWGSAGKVFGEGDVIMGFCPNCPDGIVDRNQTDPEAPDDATGFCQTCKRPFKSKETVDMKAVRMTVPDLARFLAKIFHKVKCDADLALKFFERDIRYQAGELDRKKLDKARTTRHLVIYTMRRILDDTKSGSTVESRFEAFLTA